MDMSTRHRGRPGAGRNHGDADARAGGAVDDLVAVILALFPEADRADAADRIALERGEIVDYVCVLRWFCLQRLIAKTCGLIDAAPPGPAREALAHLAYTLRAGEVAGDGVFTTPLGVLEPLASVLPEAAQTRFDEASCLTEKLVIASTALIDDAALAPAMVDEATLAMRYGRLTWPERRVVRSTARGG